MDYQKPRHNPFAKNQTEVPTASSLFSNDGSPEVLDGAMDTDQNMYGEENMYNNQYQEPPSNGGFSMSDSKPNPFASRQAGLVINTPQQINSRPAYKPNTLGAHTRPQAQRAPLPNQRPAMPANTGARPQPNNPFRQTRPPIPAPVSVPQTRNQPSDHYENNHGTPIPMQRVNSDYDYNQNSIPMQEEPVYQQPFNPVTSAQKPKPVQIHNPFGPTPQDDQDSTMQSVNLNQNSSVSTGFEDDPPLLQDLDIDIEKIKLKFLAIMTQRGFGENDIAQYDDMNGPILVAILFGILLTLKGKLEFGSIYGFGLTGCIGLQIIINLMSKQGQYVDLFTCASNLGYSLLPFCFLAALSIFIDLNNGVGAIICALIIAWSTTTATRLFEYGLDMADKKYLIAYPIILFYGVFTLITIF